MRSFHKKMLFLEMILFYVIIILAVTENTNLTEVPIGQAASRILADSDKGEKMDPYKDSNKKVAITFDDGPDADYTAMLLDGLKERNVRATFFLLGKQVDRYPKIVEQIQEDGHLIGTHAYEHVDLCKLSDAAAIEQIDRTNQAIYNVTGEYPEYIRPPYGSWKCNLDYEIRMIEVLWDVDPLDWKISNADVVAKRVTAKVQENDMILLHDASESSVKAAFRIIDELTKEGYEFVTVEEILLD